MLVLRIYDFLDQVLLRLDEIFQNNSVALIIFPLTHGQHLGDGSYLKPSHLVVAIILVSFKRALNGIEFNR